MGFGIHLKWERIRRLCRLFKRSRVVSKNDVPTGARQAATLISMSIDVAGSTEAKSRILAIAAEEGRRHQLYERFYRQFLAAEDRFYEAILRPNPALHDGLLENR
jgi:hypothetical protein